MKMVLRYQSLADFAVGTWRILLSVFVLQIVSRKIPDQGDAMVPTSPRLQKNVAVTMH
jgi:hypothetical protein